MIGRGWCRTLAGAAVALAAVALAACGGSSASSSTASNSATTAASSTSASSTTSTTTAASSAASSAGSATAAPGTKLAVGQSAKVGYTPAGSTDKSKASTLLVTVQSFDKGTLSDFNGIQLDANEKASTPVYVKVHVTNLGPASIDVDGSAAAIEGVDNTGNNQSSVTFIGDFPKCHDAASTKPIATGKGYDDCLTFLVPGGITKVSYNGTNDYIGSPVTWAPK
jgi:hypothetical protein